VKRDPSRVNPPLFPSSHNRELGLVHNHAYWASRLVSRQRAGDPGKDPARAELDTRSLACEGDPRTARVNSANGASPAPAAFEGTRWTGIPRIAPSNTLAVRLENLARATIDGRRARLSGRRRLVVHLSADGPGDAPQSAARAGGARPPCRRPTLAGSGAEVTLDRAGASFRVASGRRTYVIEVAGAGAAAGGDSSGNVQRATIRQRDRG
jgi:hypothetical protein